MHSMSPHCQDRWCWEQAKMQKYLGFGSPWRGRRRPPNRICRGFFEDSPRPHRCPSHLCGWKAPSSAYGSSPSTKKILDPSWSAFSTTKTKIRLFWKHSELRHGDASILLFPDFLADLLRKTFYDVCRWLWDKNIKYGMLYPSHHCVQHNGLVRFFYTPLDTAEWLTTLQ